MAEIPIDRKEGRNWLPLILGLLLLLALLGYWFTRNRGAETAGGTTDSATVSNAPGVGAGALPADSAAATTGKAPGAVDSASAGSP